MRRFVSLLPALALLPAELFAQGVNVNGAATPLHDTRPFGKYLVQVCTLSYGGSLECPATFPERTPQAITLKQTACVLNSGKCPEPDYPLPNGATITIRATSDSGLKVTQHVVSGDVTPRDGIGIQQYVVNGTGTIVIRATQIGNAEYAAAAPVDLLLTVASDQSDKTESGRSCSGLFAAPAPTVTEPQVDLPAILGLIGTPTPFVLAAQGKHTILIYSTRYPLNPDEKAVLSTIPSSIAELARRTVDSLGIPASSKPFKVELAIPHAAALGDLAGRISGLNYSQFTMQNIGSDRVRISASSQPDCPTWKAFLSAVRHLEWQVTPEPSDMKLYYLAATDAATAFTTLAGGASGGASTAPSTPAASAAPAATAGQGSSSATAGAATIAVNQPPGSLVEIKSDTTPCVVAGLALGNSSACAPASGTGGASSSGGSAPAASSGGGPAAPKPPAMAAMGVAAGVGAQTPSDLLVFSDTNPGDDAQITERKRILAQLDLPRPEMIVNAWVMQNSSTNPRAMGAFSNTIRNLVAGYNDALEEVVLSGWKFVKKQTKEPDYFDWDFYHYISDYYVADTFSKSKVSVPEEAAQRFLDTSPAELADLPETRTKEFGICPENRYCLGYNALFQPLKPRLTDFLLTLIAAAHPPTQTAKAIQEVQGGDEHPQRVEDENGCKKLGSELQDRCRAIWNNLGLDRETRPVPAQPGQPLESSCTVADYKYILGSLGQAVPDTNNTSASAVTKPPHPRIFLTCFGEAANIHLREPGLYRAAIADFLFNYKISQQYPHEFVPYDLSQSADGLNAALSPLIDAFNRDIVAFQAFMRADVQYQVDRLNSAHDQRCCVKWLFGLDKPSFFNDGLVTVRTISGQQAVVNTTSQSSLDASSAPTLSALLNSMNTPGGGSGTSPLAGVLGSSPSSVALLAGVLNAYQTTRVQIGRQLGLTVVPRSLSTASSAEINVNLTADETTGGPAFTGGPAGGAAPNTSRVANHDITTRVRVESVKLFELSSFSAIIQRSRSRFPLLPPFVEIPYIGTIAGIPIPGAKEYHSSTAVLSAMVVPTAADIAYGLRFLFDQVVDGDPGPCSYLTGSAGSAAPCRFRRAVSIHDLNHNPVRTFHKYMITCLATDMKSPYSSSASLTSTDTAACKNLSFDKVPHDAF